ncbi:PQQ-dependent sugar dehydrogenase [Lacinutrix iliipiscaria]|uniref:PQQ-dependent sugar dehydrogenase n=1 Tax=Lacinutrix iliipiscaria TaxID=1230532 RepID=A0ABW5WMM8_9FLAO
MKGKLFTLILIFILSFPKANAQVLPTGFSIVEVVNNIENVSCFTFVDADNILIAKQSGEIYLLSNGVLSSEPIVEIPTIVTSVGGDKGLVGLKMDPDYPTSPYVYVTYTVESAVYNRISRFQFVDSDIELSSEEVLLDLQPIPNRWHTGGSIVIDDEGHLFSSTGDNSSPGRAQLMNYTHGKIVRINKDGTIPIDNPFYVGDGNPEDIIWSMGLRNPYTMAIHKPTNTIFVNDVGQHLWEEVNDASIGGRNFGWPLEEGYNSEGSIYDPPSYAYGHTVDDSDRLGNAITGGDFYDPIDPKYPSEYVGKYFFLEYDKQWINYIDPVLDGHDHIHDLTNSRETLGTEIPRGGIYLTTSPDGYLYYFSRIENTLYKIVYYDGDEPIILEHQEDTTTMIGERTRFEITAVGAPELIYDWYKDGSLINRPVNTNIYSFPDTQVTRAGTYQVKVSNSFGEVWTNEWELTVIPFNEAPECTIVSPEPTLTYQAGDIISFEATASDTEQGVLPPENFEWYVNFHHDDHVHDGPPIAIDLSSGNFTIPDVGESSSNVYYEFIVRVHDDIGQETESSVNIYPQISSVSFVTSPPDLEVTIDGPRYQTPLTEDFVEHLKLPIGAPPYQTLPGVGAIYRLSHWSETVVDDLYTIPDDDIEITAHFAECTYPDNIAFLAFEETPFGVSFNWPATTLPCNQGFTLENLNSAELFDVLAFRDVSEYDYLVGGLEEGVEYQFRVQAYNEYGVSDYTYVSFTLGVDDTNQLSHVSVFPNPVQNYFVLDGLKVEAPYEINMYSILGQSVNRLLVSNLDGNQLQYDVSKLSKGVYFLRLSSEGKEKTFKIIKN